MSLIKTFFILTTTLCSIGFSTENKVEASDKKDISYSTISNIFEEKEMNKIDNNQCKEYQENNPCDHPNLNQGHVKKDYELLSAYNSPARIDVKGSWDVFITGSYIYWHAKEKGLDLALSRYSNQVELVNMDFDYHSGFKVGICTNFDYDSWNALVEYTRFHIKDSKKAYAKEGGYLTPTHTFYQSSEEPPTNNNASFGQETWRFDYDMIDLEIGRPCYVGKNLIFKPHIGTRIGWITQKIHATYLFTNLTDPATEIIAGSNIRSNSWLIGPRAGLDTNWLFGKGFKFFGNAAAALCYQRFNVTFKQQEFDELDHLSLNAKNKIGYLIPNLDIITGFAWGTYFWDQSWHIDISLGYEFLYFWNQNEMRALEDLVLRTSSFTKPSDLMIHGLNVTFRFDF